MAEWKTSTPIDTFEHPTTGSLIDIVSTVHVGHPSYYKKLGDYIMGRQDEGFRVHYEGIATSPDFVPSGFLENMKDRLHQARADASADTQVEVEWSSAYTMQDDRIFYEAGSSNVDVTEADYIRGLGVGAHINLLYQSRRKRRSIQKAVQKKSPEGFEEYIFKMIRANVEPRKDDSERRRQLGDKVIIGVRNEVALSGVDEALEVDSATKLVLIWGIGHLAGLRAGLIRRGYEQSDRQEVEAAVSLTILERSIEERNAVIDKLQVKINKHALRAQQGKTPRRGEPRDLLKTIPRRDLRARQVTNGSGFEQRIEEDRRKRQTSLQKNINERRQRTQNMLENLERDRKRREKAIKSKRI